MKFGKSLKETKKELEEILTKRLLIIFAIFLLVYAVSMIGISLHNLDLIHNMKNIANKVGIDPERLTDQGSDYISRNLDEYYISSINDLIKHIGLAIFLSLFIGYLIGGKEDNGKIQNRRK